METKLHITKRLERMGVRCSVARLNRYLSGDRNPDITMARAISQVTRSRKEIWLNREMKDQRKAVVQRYAKNNNLDLYTGPGNPQWRKS